MKTNLTVGQELEAAEEEFNKAFTDLTGEELNKSENDDVLDFDSLFTEDLHKSKSGDDDYDDEDDDEEEEEYDDDDEDMGKSDVYFEADSELEEFAKSIDDAFALFEKSNDKKMRRERKNLIGKVSGVIKALNKRIQVLEKSLGAIGSIPIPRKAKHDVLTKAFGYVNGKEETFDKSVVSDALNAKIESSDNNPLLIGGIEAKLNKGELLTKSELDYLGLSTEV